MSVKPDTRPPGYYDDDCELSSSTGCRGCGEETKRPFTFYCSTECKTSFEENHWWGAARLAALGYEYIGAGYYSPKTGKPCAHADETCEGGLEVDHMVPFNGLRRYDWGCLHHQNRLQPLCQSHHVRETKAQRRDGRLGTPETAAAIRANDDRWRLREQAREENEAMNPRMV